MGMQNMSVQQPMQQSQGKGVGQSIQQPPQANAAQQYFQQNPDVARSFADNNYGMSQDQFAQTHYQKYGQSEQRAWPTSNVTYPGQGGQPQMGQPNRYSNTVQPWDNASIAPRSSQSSGKGNGNSQSNGMFVAPTSFPGNSQSSGKSGGFGKFGRQQ